MNASDKEELGSESNFPKLHSDPDLNVLVREAWPEDLPAVLALYAQMDEGRHVPMEEAEAIYDQMRAYPDFRLYVAECEGRVVGTFTLLVVRNINHLGANSGLVESVVVDEALRSRRIGRAMMEFARAHCRERGCYKMALSSNLIRERAHAFYDDLGFERHGFSFRVAP